MSLLKQPRWERSMKNLTRDDTEHGKEYVLLDEALEAVVAERERCNGLAELAVAYAKDADWSRVDGVLNLLALGPNDRHKRADTAQEGAR